MTNLEPYRQQMIKRLEAEKEYLEARLEFRGLMSPDSVSHFKAKLDTVRNDLLFLDSIGHIVELRGVVS